jgi:hypothetical protein
MTVAAGEASGSVNRSCCPDSVRYRSVTTAAQRRLLTDDDTPAHLRGQSSPAPRPVRHTSVRSTGLASASTDSHGRHRYSSIRTSWSDSTNLAGSSRTADLVAGSSQSVTDRPSRSPSWPSRVLLPTVRGSLRTTTGSSASLASTTSPSCRFARPLRAPRVARMLPLEFRDSNQYFPYFQSLYSVFPLRSDHQSPQGSPAIGAGNLSWSAPGVPVR